MKHLLLCTVLIALTAGTAAPSAWQGPDFPPLDDDERLLDSAGLSWEGPGLLELFRARARTEAEPGRIEGLVRRLTGPSLEDQIHAGSDLVVLGPLAVSGLRRVANDLEAPQTRERAQRCLAWVEGPQSAALMVAAARVVARRKPAGATEALLAYLPFADNEEVTKEVTAALKAVALGRDRPDPVLTQALSDPMPLRRAVAGAVLSQAGGPGEQEAAEKLLKDANPEVRMGAAMALAKANHAPAVPVLIDLLMDLPLEKRTQVEGLLTELAGEWAPAGGPVAEDEIGRRIRRDAWASWWAHTDGPALLSVLRKRTLTPEERQKAEESIKRLGDKSYAVRERAVVEVVARGRVILPLLREALKDSDLEVKQRAERYIQRIEAEPANRLPSAALRLLGLRKPAGAAETVLAYLPFAEEDNVADAQATLARLARRNGKPDPALVAALTDKLSLVRAAAGEALATGGGPEALPVVRKLLSDADPTVRLRVGMALAPRDATAVPALIAMIPEATAEQAWQLHDFLAQMAGDKAPQAPQDTAESRKAAGAAWAAWWKENADKADLAKLSPTPGGAWLGHVVVVERNTGRIVELGRDRKPRWSIQGLQSPVDAVVLPNNRVLVLEAGGRRVSERDLKGNIIWQKQLLGVPYNVQRLPNGNTLVALSTQILELDRTGKELYTIKFPQVIAGGYKTRAGQILAVSRVGVCAHYDTAGKQLKSFATNLNVGWMDLQANGRVLLMSNIGNKIVEYSPDGKLLLDLTVQQGTTVTGQPNGNLLVASLSLNRVQELDRKGKVIWEYQTNLPFRARGR